MARMRCLAFALGSALLAPAASAAVLYKSISPEGVVQFSDIPPEKGRIVDRIALPDSSSPPNASAGLPQIAMGPGREEQLREADAAIARASIQVDLAEHALAAARRNVWSEPEPTHLTSTRMTRTDVERIEFYKRNVVAARQVLMEVLTQKRKAAVGETQTAMLR